jgi:hypothetical protein
MQRIAVEWATKELNVTEEVVRRGLFGSVEDVRRNVQRSIDDGVEEFMIFQQPRVHEKSLLRFSEEVIPAFT